MPHGLGLQRSTPSIASGSTRVASEPAPSFFPTDRSSQQDDPVTGTPVLGGFRPQASAPTTEPESQGFFSKSQGIFRGRGERGVAPRFENNPIGAIGFVLREVGAALQGKELPSVKARAAAQQDRALRLRGLGVRINALKFGIEKCGDLKGEERTACITGIANTVGDLDPDFASTLEATIGTPKAFDITKIASHPAALEFLEGAFDTDEDRRDFAISEQGQKILRRIGDKADRPVLEATLDEVFAGIAATQTPEERAGVGVSPSMIRELHRQGKIPERFKLTENMLDMLDREPELLDDRAQRFGFLTSKELEARGLAEAKREPIPEAAARAGAVAEAKKEVAGPSPISRATIRMPDSTIRTFDTRDPELKTALDAGGIEVGLNVQATTIDQLIPGTKVKGEIEKDILNAVKGLARLDAMKASFKPEFLQFFPRLVFKAVKAAERAGIAIGEETKKELAEFSTFQRRTLSNLNLYIKEITGAQMSEPEAKRLIKAMPSEDDSPTTFIAKLDDTINELRAAAFRSIHLRKMGLGKTQIDASIAAAFPLDRWQPPAGEDKAKLINIDPDGNPIFEREDGSIFKTVPD